MPLLFPTLIDEEEEAIQAPARAKADADKKAADEAAAAAAKKEREEEARRIAREEAKRVIDEEIEPAPAKGGKDGAA